MRFLTRLPQFKRCGYKLPQFQLLDYFDKLYRFQLYLPFWLEMLPACPSFYFLAHLQPTYIYEFEVVNQLLFQVRSSWPGISDQCVVGQPPFRNKPPVSKPLYLQTRELRMPRRVCEALYDCQFSLLQLPANSRIFRN